MNKHTIVVGIAVLLLAVGLSGCEEQTSTQKETDESTIIENQPPKIEECKFDYFDKENSSRVIFSGYATDYDGEIESYYWNLSDGFTSNERSFAHEFHSSGTYYATLTVVDDEGATDSRTIEVTVY